MRPSSLSIGLLTVALTTLPVSSASAQEFHRHYHYGLVGGVFGLAGAVVVGAVTIATAPIVILGDVLSGGRRDRYYHRDGYYNRRGSAYDYSGSNDYAVRPGRYSGEPDYRYPPRGAYDYPPQSYAPDQDFNRGRVQSYTPYEAYNAPARGYYSEPPDRYSPPRDYRSPRHYYPNRPYYEYPPSDERSGDNYSGPQDQFGPDQDYGPTPRSYRGHPDEGDPTPEGE